MIITEPLRKYAVFSGRARRTEYWGFMLLASVLPALFLFAGIFSLPPDALNPEAMAPGSAALGLYEAMWHVGGFPRAALLLWAAMTLALFLPLLAVTVRRLHDIDRTGWWIALYALAPVVVALMLFSSPAALIVALPLNILSLILFVFTLLDGTVGPNRFGEDPRGRIAGEIPDDLPVTGSLMFRPFRRYAHFRGRAQRKEYWLFNLFILLAAIGIFLLMIIAGLATGATSAAEAGPAANNASTIIISITWLSFLLLWLVTIIPWLAVSVRRLHDANFSEAWMALMLLGAGQLILWIFAMVDGTKGPNRYGPDPKGRQI